MKGIDEEGQGVNNDAGGRGGGANGGDVNRRGGKRGG